MKNNYLIQVSSEGMGSGTDKELAKTLVENYFSILTERKELPKFVVFYNEGVKLLHQFSSIVEIFKRVEEQGCTLLVCKTCLNRFDMLEQLGAGKACTMKDIIELQLCSPKVINL
ncbi:MAG: DsrE family protein [Bacteroidales bacterium]